MFNVMHNSAFTWWF